MKEALQTFANDTLNLAFGRQALIAVTNIGM
jgi:hypothetical protein